jgi:hypothetical protein
MKQSEIITYTTYAIGTAICLAIYWFFPAAHWGFYLFIAVCTVLAVPSAVKQAADEKTARRVLDE